MPALTHGLTTKAGTRIPYPFRSTRGGSTWSANPPQSSHVTKTAVDSQSGPSIAALITFVTCSMPRVKGSPVPGCSLIPPRPGVIHETDGSSPAAAA